MVIAILTLRPKGDAGAERKIMRGIFPELKIRGGPATRAAARIAAPYRQTIAGR
jgi:hypothetical protein